MKINRLDAAMFTVLAGMAVVDSVNVERLVKGQVPTSNDPAILASVPPLTPSQETRVKLGAMIAVAGLVVGSITKEEKKKKEPAMRILRIFD